MTTDIIILAAGQGSRMRSTMPKVLHRIGGKTMLQHVIDQSNKLTLPAVKTHVVVGHEAAQIEAAIAGQPIKIAEQREQLGTGHAVAQALPSIAKEGVSLILYGDVPLIQPGTMQALIADAEQSNLALLTVNVDNPRGYGRIVRDENNQVTAIVEHKDATLEQQKIAEINSGILALPNELLVKWLAQLNNNNAQGEYYLTDIIAMAAEEGVTINGHQPATQQEVQGVNDKAQLAYVERWYQRQEANRLMLAGATLADPNRVDIRGTVEIKGEVSIDCNVIFEGDVILEQGVSIGANCIIKDSVIGAHSIIKANSMIEESEIAAQCEIGPFARLRPGTKMANKAKIGNFVETKKAIIGEGSKVNHLSYIGDSLIGAKVNIGAGTITCNYDGVNKFTTEIGDAAFIGSNSALVAPVKVGSGATVGAGSTVTKDIAADQLAVARGKQININNWQRPVKEVKE